MESTSYLTAAEVQAAQSLHKRAPYSITGISHSLFSVSRHYGGMTYQGCYYTYMAPPHDECVRDDVLRVVTKMRQRSPQRHHPCNWNLVARDCALVPYRSNLMLTDDEHE